jgi:dTDP-4-dehydrorhamnose reductase
MSEKKKKILITGSNGLLGQKLVYQLVKENNIDVVAAARGENRLQNKSDYTYISLDITSQKAIENLLSTNLPDCIIHCAAMTNVDACELDPEACKKNNVDAVAFFIQALEKLKTPTYHPHFIQVSTDFIFNGSRGPVTEEEIPNPISIYGHSKYEAEKIVSASKIDSAILRTVLVYGITEGMSRSNIVLWVKNNLERGKEIKVVTDQFRTPTLAEDLAAGCILAMQKRATGIYNISGKDFMSINTIAHKVATFFKLDNHLIKESLSETIQQPAKRPPITGFILEKAMKELGYRPHSFEEGLALLNQQLQTIT